MGIKDNLFGDLDFDKISSNRDFSEADVRAVIIDPILKELGFKHADILREKQLKSPFLKTGSKKRKVNLIPDYIIKINNSYAFILDAKSPKQKIINDDNVEQVFSYAIHPEIRSYYFALCNGLEFACYRTTDTAEPILYFKINDIDNYWEILRKTLSTDSFQTGKIFSYTPEIVKQTETEFEYLKRPLLKEINVRKRAVKRHFGVHGYFTRQSWDIVSAYIKNFSKEGDLILDPFGGSGVTAVEALVNNRKAVNVDINPLAVFLVNSLLAPVDINRLNDAYIKIRDEFIENEPKTKKDFIEILDKYPGPKKLALPKSSDVESVPELFSLGQMAKLALLKALIKKEKDKNIRDTLLLVFSGMVTRINLTYHTTSKQQGTNVSGGDASAFRYYRYRIAPSPREIDFIKYLDIRYKKVKAAKDEIKAVYLLNSQKEIQSITDNYQNLKGTATNLSFLEDESIDYIYTDPPYGKKIPYLDLSVMWNAWLDFCVTGEDYKLEAIEGGEHQKSKDEYNMLISKSIQEMYRVLKFNRWLSFVFAHKDPEFWHLIIETCEKCGFEYAGAVPQKNGQTSFKKRQHPFTVLSGQLIINFKKVKTPKAVLKANLGMDIGEIVIQVIEGLIAKEAGATLEQINDELIIKGLELGFLDLLRKEYNDLTPLLLEKFDYDPKTEIYTIKKNTKFQTNIDIRLRINFYLLSFMRRMELEDRNPTFNEIIFAILPLLKNGITPEHQTILNVLEDIAEKTGDEFWKLKRKGQGELF